MPQSGDAGPNTIFGSADGETINGGGGNDLLFGDAGNDLLLGEADDDVLLGEAGADTLDGGEGTDTAAYISQSGLTVSLADASKNTGDATGDVFISIENLNGSQGDDWLEGDASDNYLAGKEGNDTLLGGAGADTLNGGDGIDTADYSASAAVTIHLFDNSDNSDAAAGDTLFDVENVIGSKENDRIYGDEKANVLSGGGGDDRLVGYGGADTLIGGSGNDTYALDDGSFTPVIIEEVGGGIDIIEAYVSYGLSDAAEVEIVDASSGNRLIAINLTGSRFANILIGHDGANVLDGRGGADTMRGAAGDDTYHVDDAGDVVMDSSGTDTVISSLSFSLAGTGAENLTASGAGNLVLTGSDAANVLTGNVGANQLYGASGNDTLRAQGGNDTLDGGTGADALDGGDGFDVVSFASAASGVTANLSGGTVGEAAGDSYTAIEGLIGSGFADTFTGNGAAVLQGGAGDDTYHVGAGDRVVESAGGGIDIVYTSASTIDLAAFAHVEHVIATSLGSVVVNGDAGANTLNGGSASDVLNGWAGADVMKGGTGNDVYHVDNAGDVVSELAGGGLDSVFSSVSFALAGEVENLTATGSAGISLTGNGLANTLTGNAGRNTLKGGSGNDKLWGGLGKDTLYGQSGRDVFVFDDRETGSSKGRADYLADFSGRGGDKIDLRLIDANATRSGDQRFSFIGTEAFSGVGQARYEKAGGYTYVYLNTDRDMAAEGVLKIKGAMNLSKGWFVL